jgi:hypothetical protein
MLDEIAEFLRAAEPRPVALAVGAAPAADEEDR